MKIRKIALGTVCAAGVAAAIALATPVTAHHSFSMFDQTNLVDIENAKVVQFRYTNPHSFVVVEYKGQRYVLECNSINLMSRAGWKHNTLKAGDIVSFDYYPLLNKKPGGMLKTIDLPDGRTLPAW